MRLLQALSQVWRAAEDIGIDPVVIMLAVKCRKGNAAAMRRMAEVMRKRCTPEISRLLAQYEEMPVQDNETAVRMYCIQHINEEENARGYMLWLVQAAFYGEKDAADKLEKWPFYKKFAYIPYDMLIGKFQSYVKFSYGGILHKIGLIGIPSRYEDCGISYDADKKIYCVSYLSGYEPPDEDGFGAEWEYDAIYFDEFFRRLRRLPPGFEE